MECPECHGPVPPSKGECPHCGQQMSRSNTNRQDDGTELAIDILTILSAVLATFTAGFILYEVVW